MLKCLEAKPWKRAGKREFLLLTCREYSAKRGSKQSMFGSKLIDRRLIDLQYTVYEPKSQSGLLALPAWAVLSAPCKNRNTENRTTFKDSTGYGTLLLHHWTLQKMRDSLLKETQRILSWTALSSARASLFCGSALEKPRHANSFKGNGLSLPPHLFYRSCLTFLPWFYVPIYSKLVCPFVLNHE